MEHVRDAAELLETAVRDTLDALALGDEDTAARRLVIQYAQVIDSATGHCAGCDDPDCKRSQTSSWAMRWIAPLLLDGLEALGATPAARSRLKGGKPGDAPPSQLAKLRAIRR